MWDTQISSCIQVLLLLEGEVFKDSAGHPSMHVYPNPSYVSEDPKGFIAEHSHMTDESKQDILSINSQDSTPALRIENRHIFPYEAFQITNSSKTAVYASS